MESNRWQFNGIVINWNILIVQLFNCKGWKWQKIIHWKSLNVLVIAIDGNAIIVDSM